MAGIHPLHAQHLIHLHSRLLLTGETGAACNQQVRVIGREEGALSGAHGAVLAMLGGELLTGHGEAGDALSGRVTAHQLGTCLDGDDGAEIPQIDPAMIQLLRFENTFSRGLHQPLVAGVLTVDCGLAAGDDQFQHAAGGRFLGGEDGGSKQSLADPLLHLTDGDRLLQLFEGQVLATPVGGDLGAGTHPVFLDQNKHLGIVPFGDGDGGRWNRGGRVALQHVEQGDRLFDPLRQGLVAAAVGSEQQGLHILFGDRFGESRRDAQADLIHVT